MSTQAGDISSVQVSLDSINQPCLLVSGDAVGGNAEDIKGIKLNVTATADPTGTASFAAGYAIGSKWFNVSSNKIFECYGDALWAQIWPTSVDASTDLTGQVPVVNGGTGLSSCATGDLLYGSASNVLSKRTIGSTNNVLKVSSGLPSWGALDLASSNAVSGVLDETNGGTGLSSYSTGDIPYASGSNTLAKRAIGSTGQVLTVSGGVPTWADAASGESMTYITTISARVTTTGSVQTVGSQYMNVAAGDYVFRFAGAVASGATCKLGYKINAGSDVFPTNSDTVNAVFSVPITLAANDDITFRAQVSSATNYLSLEVWLVN